jgi:hypothetical protein
LRVNTQSVQVINTGTGTLVITGSENWAR